MRNFLLRRGFPAGPATDEPRRYRPRPPRAVRVIRWSAAVLAALVVVAAITVPVLWPSDNTCLNQGMTLLEHEGPNGECIGFSDGAYVFDPSLAAVERDIQQEDQRVTAAHPTDYVSVVYLLPISSAGGSILSMGNALEQLRGAFTAQYYANRHDIDGSAPYIQLLIGNDGYQADQWQPATQFIINAVPTQHVAAVAGLGLSLETTQSAIEKLTSAGMPVIGATLTSDTLDNIRNLIRISPANADGVAVAARYIRTLYSRALLVEDQNAGDSYDATLVTGFEKFADAGHRIIGKEIFDTTPISTAAPPADAVDALETRIAQMVPDICDAQPAAVLFGGRGRQLSWLVSDLADRPCLDKPITIVSGDDVTNATIDANVRRGLASGVTVDYAGVAQPDEWSGTSDKSAAFAEGRQGFEIFRDAFVQLFPGGHVLPDGNTMAAYDATLTSIAAIRLTAVARPAPAAVAGELGALQRAHQVLGASGPLSFTADYATSSTGSNPVGKAVPILRLAPDGGAQFVGLQWPDGQPPAS